MNKTVLGFEFRPQGGNGQRGALKEMATQSSILVLRIPMDRGAWRAIVHGVTESRTRLSDLAHYMPSIQLIHISVIFLNRPMRNLESQTA